MSSIGLPTSLQNARIETYTRLDGVDTVHVQAVVPANPFDEVSGTLAAVSQTVAVSGFRDASGILAVVSGTFAGTLAFEASVDGTNWYTVMMSRASTSTFEATRALTGTTLEAWRANIAGWPQFRVRCSAYTSGTANIRLVGTSVPFEPPGNQSTVLSAGSAAVGDVGLQVRANATGASSIHHIVSAATTGATIVKATAGRVLGWCLSNTTATWRYVKLYNVATTPVPGTTTVASTIAIPPNGTVAVSIPQGIGFATGIGRSTVTGAADADATAVAVNDVVGDIFFA